MREIYTYEDAMASTLDHFSGDKLPADVFISKYALRDNDNNIVEKNPSMMHRRLAREFARIESKYVNPMSEDEIYDMFSDWTVVAQGGPMAAIGNPYQVQSVSNCFVIQSPYDSYAGIMKTDQEQVQIMKRRGGVGFDMSTIRPKGMSTANAARTTDGVASFMQRFSNTCREVAQGGRRGALMLTISVHHPDVLEFANIKRDRKKVTGANVSVMITDEFMRALKNGEKYQQRFPIDPDVPHAVERWVDAREVWDNIISAMRDCSEPGFLFIDTIRRMSPADCYSHLGYKTVSTNPCGELPLSPGDSCRLLLLNLSKFVIDPFTPNARFDFERFSSIAMKAQRLMDDLVDLELEAIDKIINKVKLDPEPDDIKRTEIELWNKIRKAAEDGRRTGLGITALGDTFAFMNMKYGSDETIDLTEKIYKTLALSSYKSSVIMAKERGAFPIFSHDAEKDNPFINRVMDADPELREMYKLYGRRNIANLTTSPAGSTSLLTQTTSGCEPVLFIKSKRKRKVNPDDVTSRVDFIDELGDKWQYYDLYHKGVKLWMEVTGNDNVDESPYAGTTVEEIDWLKKIDIQAAAQKWVDHSISNTTNLPNDVSVDTVNDLCLRAWETGCKGVTIYRIGSRDAVIEDASENTKNVIEFKETNAPKRPKVLECDIHRTSIRGQKYVVLVGLLNNKPYEVFAGLAEQIDIPKKFTKGNLIKVASPDGVHSYNLVIDSEHVFNDVVNLFDNPQYGAFTRTISLLLRHGTPIKYLVEQLRKDKYSDMVSFSSVIARILAKNYIKDGTKVTSEKMCPECKGANLQYYQGCVTCFDCGNSKCG